MKCVIISGDVGYCHFPFYCHLFRLFHIDFDWWGGIRFNEYP